MAFSSRKRLIFGLMVCLLLLSSTGQAQTWGEFFNQKKTQKRYLLQQIVALQVYIGYAKKGYDIASSGLGLVRDITGGEFNLHNTFISSLKAVSPVIRNNVKVAEIIAYQLEIGKSFGQIKNTERLTLSNWLYILDVKAQLMAECMKDLEELLMVISSGKLEMSDDQRISRLDSIYESMTDKAAFTQDFCSQVYLLIQGKEKETRGIDQLKLLYGIME